MMTIDTSSIEPAGVIAPRSYEDTESVCVEAATVIHIQSHNEAGRTVLFRSEMTESGTSISSVVNSIANENINSLEYEASSKAVELDGDVLSSSSTQVPLSIDGNHKIFGFSLKVETQDPTSRGNLLNAKANDGQQKGPAFVTRHFFPLQNGEPSLVQMPMEYTGGNTFTESHWTPLTCRQPEGTETRTKQPENDKPVKKSRRGPRSRSSQYRGVTFYRRTGRWESHIWDCGKQVYLGGFDTAQAAARAYDRAAIKFRGVEADINFTLSDYQEDLNQRLNMMEGLKEQSFGVPASTVSFWPMKQQQSGWTWQLHASGPTSPVFTTTRSPSSGFSPQIHTALVTSTHGSRNMGVHWSSQSTEPCVTQTPSLHLATRLSNGTDSCDHRVGLTLDFQGKKMKRLSVESDN